MKNIKLTNLLMIAGTVLIIASVAIVLGMQLSGNRAEIKVSDYAAQLKYMMPEIRNGVPDNREDTEMPVVEVDGIDFIGTLEVPKYDKNLPVYKEWGKGKGKKMPCRYTGSMYDGSLIIGTSENKGQFDITNMITGGDSVTFTDMTGLCYNYIVTDIHKTKDVSTENLQTGEGDLTLFVKSSYGSSYMIVKCMVR